MEVAGIMNLGSDHPRARGQRTVTHPPILISFDPRLQPPSPGLLTIPQPGRTEQNLSCLMFTGRSFANFRVIHSRLHSTS